MRIIIECNNIKAQDELYRNFFYGTPYRVKKLDDSSGNKETSGYQIAIDMRPNKSTD